MNPLEHLASLLRPATQEAQRPVPSAASIDAVLDEMRARSRGHSAGEISSDHQLEAVRRFWDSQEVKSFRDAYLLSASLCVPHRSGGECILEDEPRFQRVLDGADEFRANPRAYRRCYQGLVKSYFNYDGFGVKTSPAGRENWLSLRDYLDDRNLLIKGEQHNPEWVDTAIGNRELFAENPCEPYVGALLRGDSGVIDHLCEQLGITKASWFLRELVLAQVEGATLLGNFQFQELLPRLLSLLSANEVLRDRGMVMVLDRYSGIPGSPLHQGMRDHCVGWWGNPWLPSTQTAWQAVKPTARTMVADWLKLEFIETFFTKLAEDGFGDPRRMNFWKRYVKAIDHIEFALGATARNSVDRDLVVLRKKMDGIVRELDAAGTNNAFIMRMGPLVAVEFSGMGNAFYGYDARKSIPFDTTRPLRLTVDAHNSLKKKRESVIWLSHQDGIHNWDRWEEMFEATLRKEFGIEPSVGHASPRRVVSPPAEAPAPQQYSRAALNKLARDHGLDIDDMTARGGNLWVREPGVTSAVQQQLIRWGFKNKAGKGWWR
jgi:hypothetical protein